MLGCLCVEKKITSCNIFHAAALWRSGPHWPRGRLPSCHARPPPASRRKRLSQLCPGSFCWLRCWSALLWLWPMQFWGKYAHELNEKDGEALRPVHLKNWPVTSCQGPQFGLSSGRSRGLVQDPLNLELYLLGAEESPCMVHPEAKVAALVIDCQVFTVLPMLQRVFWRRERKEGERHK